MKKWRHFKTTVTPSGVTDNFFTDFLHSGRTDFPGIAEYFFARKEKKEALRENMTAGSAFV